MPIRVAINGFGRIGRMAFRAIAREKEFADLEVVAINDLLEPDYLAYMLQYDSVHGNFDGRVEVDGSDLLVDGRRIRLSAERHPEQLAWGEVQADVVIEATGHFLNHDGCSKHLHAGARKVVQSAPAKDSTPMFVYGVNHDRYAGEDIVSAASCTTNGLAPVAKVLHETWGIDRGLLTTVHAYTNSQKTVDTAAKDLRDARAAALNIVPSSTGAAKAVGLVIPALQGKFTGMAFRVPTPTVSVVDFTALLTKDASPAEINAAMKKAAEGPLKGILRYTEKELVSTDLKGDPHSSIFSAVDTIGLGNFVKVVSWYDNEWGYSNRVADLLNFLEDRGL